MGVKCSKAIIRSEITRDLRVFENLQEKKGVRIKERIIRSLQGV